MPEQSLEYFGLFALAIYIYEISVPIWPPLHGFRLLDVKTRVFALHYIKKPLLIPETVGKLP